MIARRDTLDDILERLEKLYEEGEMEKARKELRRARRLYAGDLVLLEWEATFARDESRYEDALRHLDAALAVEPTRAFARREKAAVLMGLARFEEALKLLDEIGPQDKDDAAYHFDRGLCLDRLDRSEEADRAFKQASRLDQEGFALPARLSREEFEEVVQQALDEIPERLQSYLENVIVEVADYPRSPPLEPGMDPFLLGLYVGVPRTERTQEVRDNLDRIFIFKRNLETEFPSKGALKEEIRKTVIHEIAHHFGMGEEDMGEYE